MISVITSVSLQLRFITFDVFQFKITFLKKTQTKIEKITSFWQQNIKSKIKKNNIKKTPCTFAINSIEYVFWGRVSEPRSNDYELVTLIQKWLPSMTMIRILYKSNECEPVNLKFSNVCPPFFMEFIGKYCRLTLKNGPKTSVVKQLWCFFFVVFCVNVITGSKLVVIDFEAFEWLPEMKMKQTTSRN